VPALIVAGGSLVGRAAAARLEAVVEMPATCDALLRLAMALDPEKLPTSTLDILRPLLSDPNLATGTLSTRSAAAVGLCRWVKAVGGLARGSRELEVAWEAVLETQKEMEAGAKVVAELAEDVEQEAQREVLLARKHEKIVQERQELDRELDERREEAQRLHELLCLIDEPVGRATEALVAPAGGGQLSHLGWSAPTVVAPSPPVNGPSLLGVWVEHRMALSAQLEQLTSSTLLGAISEQVDGYLPAGEQHLILMQAWEDAAAEGLAMPNSYAEALDSSCARLARARGRSLPTASGGECSGGADPSESAGGRAATSATEQAVVRSLGLFQQACATKVQPEREKLMRYLLEAAEQAAELPPAAQHS